MAPHERDALVNAYEHLNSLPRAPDALNMLKKIASVVKPIMRGRGWKVGTLTEFYPHEQSLLGLNVNRGQRVCLRLRYAGDNTLFMPLENVIDTMLHELSHNVFGPHDEKFNNLWNALRDEYTDLKIKGYTGEGFLSEGHRLGGRRVPIDEVRRQARSAAEKRKVLQKNSGQKVGGQAIPYGSDVRSIIADATQRRIDITIGCASGTQDGDRIAHGPFNGFRTKAEEDDANERAINQALWELVQEDEARKAGVAHENQSWNSEGLTWNPDTGLDLGNATPPSEDIKQPADAPPIPSRSPLRRPAALSSLSIPQEAPPLPSDSKPHSATSRPISIAPRLNNPLSRSQSTRAKPYSRPNPPPTLKPTVYQEGAGPSKPTPENSKSENLQTLAPVVYNGAPPTLAPTTYKPPAARSPNSNSSPVGFDISGFDDDYHGPGSTGPSVMRPAASSLPSRTWTCPTCTLCNRVEHLCCNACGTEKPSRDETPITPIDSANDILSEFEIAQIAREISRREREQELEAEAAAERARLYGLAPQRVPEGPIGWSCRGCGSFMENQWWTCSACGKLKDSS
ncbi:hypothetical protein FH972_025948 [Carpinus fangiana]|uniref:WLM domain-containing protein n=1 Tax=Carpinus fangiana TaxID=176857 RepID=A0A5N6L2W4_9ROSI|nr:hypothetical protein FH972_025948 [Carpinus fangiana]